MNQNPISPDDPRLTAYALDEMAPVERAEFEPLLRQDAAARQAVEEIRAAGALLTAALENEPLPVASQSVRPAAIIAGRDFSKLDGGPLHRPGKLLTFPRFYYMVSGLAAACFAVLFVLWQSNYKEKQATHLIEVPLSAPVAEAQARKPEVESPGRRDAQAAVAADESKQQEGRAKDAGAVAMNLPAAPAAEEPVQLDKFEVAAAPAVMGGLSRARVAGKTMRGRDADRSLDAVTFGGARPTGRTDATTEAYGYHQDNDFLRVADEPLSTFSIDVDTASYANVRRFLLSGRRPPVDAVRIEELVNYFPYHYAPPADGAPFAVALEAASAPWNPAHRLVRIGLKAREVTEASRPPANLVFLIDVSGSMDEPNKLPLVKQSLRLLVNQLRPDDHVAIAIYAGASGLALPSTSAARQGEILDAIDRLEASGSTNGEMGIQLAYDIAKANFIPGGVNRVILATDGDFNVGVTSGGELVRLVQEKAKSGVFLSVLGFGMGNIKDDTLEQLADQGHGNYAYIDSLAEARKALVEQAGGTLVTVAKDVKLQVEFNPAVVAAYRLIGYEDRLLAREDFNNDRVDASDVGAGHTVTALYEVVPAGSETPGAAPAVDALKYQNPASRESRTGNKEAGEMLTVKIRYKEPTGDVSNKLEFPLRDSGMVFANATPDFKFAAAVAAFGMVLRDSPHRGTSTLPEVAAWGRAGNDSDAGGYRAEFISLVERAQAIP